MRFFISDADFKETCDGVSCCGLPETMNFTKGNFLGALFLAKSREDKKAYFRDVLSNIDYFDKVNLFKADGFNASGLRAKLSKDTTFIEYLKYLWNIPTAGQSPHKVFNGALKPTKEIDTEGNIIYIFCGEEW